MSSSPEFDADPLRSSSSAYVVVTAVVLVAAVVGAVAVVGKLECTTAVA